MTKTTGKTITMPRLGKGEKRCCICREIFTGFGHNPDPLGDFDKDRCCDRCNREAVIPARIADINKTVKAQSERTDVPNRSITVEGDSDGEILENTIIGTIRELDMDLSAAAASLVIMVGRALGNASTDARNLKQGQRYISKTLREISDDVFQGRVAEATRDKARSKASAIN
jgi:hypothetical protein